MRFGLNILPSEKIKTYFKNAGKSTARARTSSPSREYHKFKILQDSDTNLVPRASVTLVQRTGARGSGRIQNRNQKTLVPVEWLRVREGVRLEINKITGVHLVMTIHMSINTSPNSLETFKLRRIANSNERHFSIITDFSIWCHAIEN